MVPLDTKRTFNYLKMRPIKHGSNRKAPGGVGIVDNRLGHYLSLYRRTESAGIWFKRDLTQNEGGIIHPAAMSFKKESNHASSVSYAAHIVTRPTEYADDT